jgi:methionyl-tRNA synthetase
MSKSRGNVVNPFTELNRLGNDAIRYYLLKEGSLQHDGDYNDERINSSLNVDLADTLGNLLQRCTAASINPSQTIPTPPQAADITPADRILEDAMKWLCGTVPDLYSHLEFSKGIEAIFQCLSEANRYLTHAKPWELVRDPSTQEYLSKVLSLPIESLRLSGLLLQPVVPDASRRMLNRLGIPLTSRSSNFIKYCLDESHNFSRSYGSNRILGTDKSVLFKKIT